MTTRRKFIASVGTVGTVAIAGCSSVRLIGGGRPEKAVEQLFTLVGVRPVHRALRIQSRD